jgi:iron complex outermembrane receptor protein
MALLYAMVEVDVLHAAPNAPTDQSPVLAEVTVIGVTPLDGSGIDAERVPGAVRIMDAAERRQLGGASIASALETAIASVSINDNAADPFQPDLLYRGFAASPILGTPQGLAVYQNGVRINEAFGDTVNWDLVPDIAIRRTTVAGPNPVYGLNALGGAVVLTMKDAFSADERAVNLSAGQFGVRDVSAETHLRDGDFGLYLAVHGDDRAGWRQFSPDAVRQLYADIGYQRSHWRVDLSLTAADNRLNGQGAAPVQELAVDRTGVFTHPQQIANRLTFLVLNISGELSQRESLQANSFLRNLRALTVNGNTTSYTDCAADSPSPMLCQADGVTPLTDLSGQTVQDPRADARTALGEIDSQAIHSLGVGAGLQWTSTVPLLGRDDHRVLGITVDQSSTRFDSSAVIGTILPDLSIRSAGITVLTPEGGSGTATPVALAAMTRDFAMIYTDTWSVSPSADLTASARYNATTLSLRDQRGTALTGDSHYARLNPALGLTQRFADHLSGYAGYAQSTRVPTPGEIECADPAAPCVLPSSLSSDPPTLRQVVGQTWEMGLRGQADLPITGSNAVIRWSAGVFRTDLKDDLYAVATSLSAGYFRNIPGTRRQGLEMDLHCVTPRTTVFADLSLIEATFRSDLLLPSALNPYADRNGDLQVHTGDRLPGIPMLRMKLGLDHRLGSRWMIGGSLAVNGNEYLRGDEANRMAPLGGYSVMNLHLRFALTGQLEGSLSLNNALNRRYSNFGLLGDPTGIGAPGIPVGAASGDAGVDPRFLSPSAPFSAIAGLRIRF